MHLYGGPALVVDFGTSTNFDAISARGEFVGGALAPGIEISVDSLSRRAAQLLKVELARPQHVIGKNTVECLQAGVLYGCAEQVDGLVRRILHELGPGPVTVIGTGGLAPLLIDNSGLLPTMPIRRLALAVDDSSTVPALPDLLLTRLPVAAWPADVSKLKP